MYKFWNENNEISKLRTIASMEFILFEYIGNTASVTFSMQLQDLVPILERKQNQSGLPLEKNTLWLKNLLRC